MDIIDLFWNISQDRSISDLAEAQKTHLRRGGSSIKRLEEENYELRLRLSLLIRLLIERGIFSAHEYSGLIQETKDKLAAGAGTAASKRVGSASAVEPKAQRSVRDRPS